MGVYDEDIASALEMIAEAGKPVVLVRPAESAPPAQPWDNGTPAEVLEPAVAVFLNFSSKDVATRVGMAGAPEIDASHRKVLMPASPLTSPPTTHDVVRDETGDWAIVYVNTLSPNGQDILHTLQVSR